jgi:adenylate cyclase
MHQPNGRLIPADDGRPISLACARVLLGRRPSCDVQLDYSFVSSEHCELRFMGGFWVLRDLDSKNGTKVNGKRVQQTPLKPGDEIIIGKLNFTIEYSVSKKEAAALADVPNVDEVMSEPLWQRAARRKPDKSRRFAEEEDGELEDEEDEEDED